jgi:hypothetical protein
MQFAWLSSTYHFDVRNNFLFRPFLEVLKLSAHILPFVIYQCGCILSILMPNLQSLQFCTFLIQACYFLLFLLKFLLESLKKIIHIEKHLHTESYCHPPTLCCTVVSGYQQLEGIYCREIKSSGLTLKMEELCFLQIIGAHLPDHRIESEPRKPLSQSLVPRDLCSRKNYTDRATAVSEKLVPTSADIRCHVVSVTDPVFSAF